MEPIGPYLECYRELVTRLGVAEGRASFVAMQQTVLVKHPVVVGVGEVVAGSKAPSFVTEHIDLGATAALGAFAPRWLVVRLQKRPDHAFPDRLSFGRATNCDVVVRFPFISKLQGHLMLEDGVPVAYVDYGGANPGRIDGVTVSPKVSTAVSNGTRLAVGPLEFELTDPKRLLSIVSSLADAR